VDRTFVRQLTRIGSRSVYKLIEMTFALLTVPNKLDVFVADDKRAIEFGPVGNNK
jgi:hypothetical protein